MKHGKDIPSMWSCIISQGMESSCVCIYASNAVKTPVQMQLLPCSWPRYHCHCRWKIMCNFLPSLSRLMCAAVIAGDGNCGYRAVLAGLIESAQSSLQLKRHLLQRLPKLMKTISTLEVVCCRGTSFVTYLQHGCTHVMVGDHSFHSCVAPLHAFTPAGKHFSTMSK